MHRIDSDGATPANLFTDTPEPGQNATTLAATWLNAVQEEISNFLENNGVTLDKENNTQLSTLMGSLLAASAILTKIKTVDGAASGLDADLVDGQHASAFATAAQGAAADAALPAGNYTASDVLVKVKTVDGPASGLNADLLDGLHSSSFATSAQGATADLAAGPVDTGSSVHAGGKIKTKILTLSISSSTSGSVAHGISNAYSSHRIIDAHCIWYNGTGSKDYARTAGNMEPELISWDNSTVTVGIASSASYTYYLVITYV